MTLRELTTHANLMDASGGDPMVKYEIPLDLAGVGYALDGATAIPRRAPTGRLSMTFVGPDDAALRLLREVHDAGALSGQGGVSVAQSALGRARALVPLGDGNDWDWMYAVQPPPVVAGESEVVPLGEADRDDIEALLADANPRTFARPFATGGQRWSGIREGGRLVAIGCDEAHRSPILSGITVDEVARGRGLGLAVTAHLSRAAIARSGVCLLGMYSENAVGRRLYTGLGFILGHAISSRRLLPA